MVWHDCKTDPPKEDGPYIVLVETNNGMLNWYKAYWFNCGFAWTEFGKSQHWKIIKWAEVELPE